MEQVLTTAEATEMSSQLGFTAQSVIVDNYSQEWAYCLAAGRYIRPYAYGEILVFPSGTTQAEISWSAPPGQVNLPGTPLGKLTATWSSEVLAPTNGDVIFPSGLTAIDLGTLAANGAAGGWATPAIVTLPPGTQALMVTCSGGAVKSIAFTGHTTGDIYDEDPTGQVWASYTGSVPYTGADAKVEVTGQLQAGATTGTVHIIAIKTTANKVVAVAGGVITSVGSITGTVNTDIVSVGPNIPASGNSLPVVGPGGADLPVNADMLFGKAWPTGNPMPVSEYWDHNNSSLLSGLATANGNTLFTIPAGVVWKGSLAIQGAGAAAGFATASITGAGGAGLLGIVIPGNAAVTTSAGLSDVEVLGAAGGTAVKLAIAGGPPAGVFAMGSGRTIPATP